MSLAQGKDLAAIVQSMFTVLAIVVGGFWSWRLFFRKRLNRPWAKVTNHVEHRRREDGKTLLHVAVHIENVGQVLLRVAEGFVRVQQVLPSDVACSGECNVEEFPYSLIKEKSILQGTQEIEPGEEDERHFDFLLEEHVKTVIVYSHIRNLSKRNIGWNATTFCDIPPEEQEETQFMAGTKKLHEQNVPKPRPQPVQPRPASTGTGKKK